MFELAGKIVGDGTQWAQTLDRAVQDSTAALKELEDQGLIVGGAVSIAGVAMTEAIKSVSKALIDLGEQSLDAWMETEDTLVSLQSVISASGGDVALLTQDYQSFASAMQEVTVLGDDTILSILQTAEAFGISGDAAKRAAQDAIAIAAINNSNAESMIRMTARMAEGDIKGAMAFGRMVPQLRGVRDEMEFLTKYQALVSGGMETATKLADTMSGSLKQLSNDWGDVQEDIGRFIAEGLRPMVRLLNDVVKWVKSWDEDTKRLVFTFGQMIVIIGTGAGLIAMLAALAKVFGLVTVAAGLTLSALWPLMAIAGTAIAISVGFEIVTGRNVFEFISGEDAPSVMDPIEVPVEIKVQEANIQQIGEEIAEAVIGNLVRGATGQNLNEAFSRPEFEIGAGLGALRPREEVVGDSPLARGLREWIVGIGPLMRNFELVSPLQGAGNLGVLPPAPTPRGIANISGLLTRPETIATQLGLTGSQGGLGRLLVEDEEEESQTTRLGNFRSNLQEEERQFLALQAGRRGGPEEQTAQGVQRIVQQNDELLDIQRGIRNNGQQLAAANL